MPHASHLALLQPFFRENLGERLRNSPKLHLLDPGLHASLLGLHGGEPLRHGPSLGAMLESAVVGEWRKAFVHRGEPGELRGKDISWTLAFASESLADMVGPPDARPA
ncbi:MAG: DUF4143 domain-containing protein [Planctomycetes bacterium]|nr:DUF4143 domain-containing protein [Planctomycetota bacterium]